MRHLWRYCCVNQFKTRDERPAMVLSVSVYSSISCLIYLVFPLSRLLLLVFELFSIPGLWERDIHRVRELQEPVHLPDDVDVSGQYPLVLHRQLRPGDDHLLCPRLDGAVTVNSPLAGGVQAFDFPAPSVCRRCSESLFQDYLWRSGGGIQSAGRQGHPVPI